MDGVTMEIKTKTDREIIAWVIYSTVFSPERATEIIGYDWNGWRMGYIEQRTVDYICNR